MQTLLEKKSAKPPAIFRRPPSLQYMAYIGYHHAKIGPAIGKRVRKVHYLGRDEREATLNAILIDRRWDQVVADWKKWKAERLSSGFQIPDEHRLPFWPTEEDKQRVAEEHRRLSRSIDDLIAEGLWEEDLPPEEEEAAQRPYFSLTSVKEKYLEGMESRVGLIGDQGLKSGTVKQLSMALNTAMRGINGNRNLLDLTREDLRVFVHYWSSPERNLARRTVANYCKTFKRMIEWADEESLGGFTKPKFGKLFKFSSPRGTIERFDSERLKTLLAIATDRCRLYVLLALNTGYNQVDISDLRRKQLVVIDGDTFLVRARQKASHQNDFRTQHYLWPETVSLLNRHFAPHNRDDYALLNVNGKPLLVGGTDNIRDTMHHARKVSGVKEITYKQLRKFGINAIRRVGLDPDTARMYASHKIAGPMSNYDRDDFFDPLTAALKKWREELVSLGIMALANPLTSASSHPEDNDESNGDGQDSHAKAT